MAADHQPRDDPGLSNNNSRMPVPTPYSDQDPDHPDLPLPIEQSDNDNTHDEDETKAAASRPRHAWQARSRNFWLRYKGMVLVLLAQMFGASMNVMTQVLEIHSSMHPFQVLFARMSITAVASYAYMFYMHTPHPLGTRDVLGWLLLRAVCGFTGVYGLYYSVQYLPLSEATVITFLAPIMTCYACSWKIPGETFSRRQQLAAVVSLAGVVLIARPFSKRSSSGDSENPDAADSYHHILATVVAFVGVIGAAGAYTSIRLIGKRAHPLVSVTYFSTVTTVISLVAMACVPGIPFRFPSTKTEWGLLGGLGVCGFLLQFLLTAGLSYVPPASVAPKAGQGARATSMVYTQMLFALFYDKVVWGSTPKPISVVGSALILCCAVYVAVAQEPRTELSVDRGDPREEGLFKDDAADEECAGP
ncbi:hypothetical protein N7510_007479 [Penicillium lagena]|uniref:uncharacterized protein n=1 Tax=Penicillium lagena TaxID=94218 RepID=UPI002540D854|nr:uncharacterized protein N7510_007479 [Penicillium lagena]KAJ5610760.1 hypothetical protein N7510_007479 [Penicillium lagena]